MPNVICYWLEPIARVRRSLRRYRPDGPDCPKPRPDRCLCCDNSISIDEIDYPVDKLIEEFNFRHDDPCWPKECDRCGYVFQETDEWQGNGDRVYKRSDTGAEMTLRDATPGAMWNAFWMESWKGPDGMSLVLKLPGNHDWMIDGPSTTHPAPNAWTRTGTPPKITVSPSIVVPGFHAWLRDGVLTEC